MELVTFKERLSQLCKEGDAAIEAVETEAKSSTALQEVIQPKVDIVKNAVSQRIDELVGQYVSELGTPMPPETLPENTAEAA